MDLIVYLLAGWTSYSQLRNEHGCIYTQMQ